MNATSPLLLLALIAAAALVALGVFIYEEMTR